MAKQKSLTQVISENLAQMERLMEDTKQLVQLLEKKVSHDTSAFIQQLQNQASFLTGETDAKAPKGGKQPPAVKAPKGTPRPPRVAEKAKRQPRTKAGAGAGPASTPEPGETGAKKRERKARKGQPAAAGGDPDPASAGPAEGAARQDVVCQQCGKPIYSDDPEKKCRCGE